MKPETKWHDGRRPRVELIYFDAGGGHRAAADALHAVLGSKQPSWEVARINLRERLQPLDFIQRLTGVNIESFYNGLLKSNLTVGIGPMLRVMHLLIRQMHGKMTELLAQSWSECAPDLVVSLIPHFNRAIFAGLRAADSKRGVEPTPMVTIMTDLADYPPHFWIERQDQYIVCGTAEAARQALAAGLPAQRILRSSGMIVRPEFYQETAVCRPHELQRLGLQPDLPTALVMFGGFGSRRMELIARRLAEANLPIQVIFLCGRNHELRQRLSALALPFPHHIEGFTSAIPNFMRLADFFIGKPGPGSISEALVIGLPVIVERNALVMVHERFNTDWVLRRGVGLVIKSFAEIDQAVAAMIAPATLADFRNRIAAMRNQAIFEIPAMMAGLVETRGRGSDAELKIGA